MADDTDRLAIAIHEAGHVVAHIRLRIEHDGATVIPDQDRWTAGAAFAAGQKDVWNKADAADMVLAFCAGYGAVLAAGLTADAAQAGAGDDFEQAQELIDFWGLSGGLDYWKTRTADFMRRPVNVAAVALVAQHLLERGRLDGELTEVLVDVSDGGSTAEDLARYLVMRERAWQRQTDGDLPAP